MAFSPESLAKAILSSDVIKYIAKFVRGEHEFKANQEILSDKVYWLLEQGLNDAIAGWNENKAAEIGDALALYRSQNIMWQPSNSTTIW